MEVRFYPDRLRCFALLLPLLALALLVAACGEQGHSAADPACPSTVPAVAGGLDRLELAVAQAMDRSVPLLVLISRHHSHCPPAARLETLLRTTPGLEARCSFVVVDGGPGTHESERELVARVCVGASVPPLLVVATPQLEVLHVQVSGLMPYYDLGGEPMAHASGHLFTGEDVLALLERVSGGLRVTDERLAHLTAPSSPQAKIERVELLVRRGRWEAAKSAAAAVDPQALSMKEARRLFDALMVAGAREQARALADGLLAEQPKAKGTGWLKFGVLWHFEQDTEEFDPQRLGSHIEAAKASGCRALEVSLRALRVRVLSKVKPLPVAELDEDLRVVRTANRELFKNHEQDGPRVFATLAYAALLRRDFGEAERLIVQLDDDYPDSGEAVRFRHGTLDRVQRAQESPPPPRGPEPKLPEMPRPGR